MSTSGPAILTIRLDRLTTLRAAAAIAVFVVHAYTAIFGDNNPSFRNTIASWPLGAALLAKIAGFGVQILGHSLPLFFILSGFIVHRTFHRWRNQNHGSFAFFFLWHRFWRLVPTFWIILIFAYFVHYDDPFSAYALRRLIVNATLLKTLYPGYFSTIDYAHWYIAVQWQIDLLYPAFLLAYKRLSPFLSFVIGFTLALLFVTLVPRLTTLAYITNLPFAWWMQWGLGALIAEMHARGRRLFVRPLVATAGCILGIALSSTLQFSMGVWLGIHILLAVLFEISLFSRSPQYMIERWIKPIGVCGLSFFLIHGTIIALTLRFFSPALDIRTPLGALLFAGVALTFTTLAALLAFRWIEQPFSNLGVKLWRSVVARKLRPIRG